MATVLVLLQGLVVVRAVQGSSSHVLVVAVASQFLTAALVHFAASDGAGALSDQARRALARAVRRLTASVLLLGLLPLGALAWFTIDQSRAAVEGEVRTRMAVSASAGADFVAQDLLRVRDVVSSYADRRLLQAAAAEPGANADLLAQQLGQLAGRLEQDVAVGVFDEQGYLVRSVPAQPGNKGRNFAGRDYFRGADRSGGPYVSRAYVPALAGNPLVVGVSAPLVREGKRVGVLVVAYRLTHLTDYVDRVQALEQVQLSVVDQEGTYIAGPRASSLEAVSSGGDATARAALAGDEVVHQVDGQLQAGAAVPELGWGVLVSQSRAAALGQADTLGARVLAVATLLAQALLLGMVAATRVEGRRRRAEFALQEREDNLRGILDAAGDAYVALDGDGVVTTWNGAAARMFGWSLQEAVGRPVAELIVPVELVGTEAALIPLVVAGGAPQLLGHRTEFAACRNDLSRLLVEGVLWCTTDQGRTTYSAFLRDITERKRQEAELADARDAALEASRLKSEFVANMSHEIRTPMNGVLGMTSLLLETPLDLRQREFAETVHGSAEALLTVINDILDFSKIEAGKLEVEAVDFDVRALVDDVAALLAEPAHSKRLELTAIVGPGVPDGVRADPHRIRQVLVNLLGNAVKFTTAGEVGVLVTANEVRGTLTFAVRDTGLGIRPDTMRRLFEPFSQGDASTTRRYGGTGLGLTITRQLVDLMGGTLDVESEVGVGSTFSFTLPLVPASAPLVAAPVRLDLAGVRALVVDDNATNRLVLQHYLAGWDMRVDCATSGDLALQALRAAAAQDDAYELVVLDMHMPGLDGAQVAARIAADPVLCTVPIALLTSTSDADELDRARAAGVQAYLSKPVREGQLRDCVGALLGPGVAPAPQAPGPSHVDHVDRVLGRVLVVEDNPVNQLVVVGMLRSLGYDSDVASDGLEGLERLGEREYDAVLMDCQMPRLDGFETTGLLRAEGGPAARTPVIALTASALREDEQRCRDAGMDDFLAKPVRKHLLGEVLQRWVSGPSVPAQGTATDISADSAGDVLEMSFVEDLRSLGAEADVLVSAFLTSLPGRVDALAVAAAEGDLAELRARAHALKGAAGSFGGAGLAAVCAQLESCPATQAVALAERAAGLADRTAAALRTQFPLHARVGTQVAAADW